MTKRNWDNVADELCYCGCKRSEHFPTKETLKKGGIEGDERFIKSICGHGCCSKCKCERFTWKCFIDKDGKVI